MEQVYNTSNLFIIRLGALLSLIFFVMPFYSCKQKKEEAVAIIWKNNQATGIQVSKELLLPYNEETIVSGLQVMLSSKDAVPMMGSFESKSHVIHFLPLVPLSRGLTYDIFFQGKRITQLQIPNFSTVEKARLLAVYPTADTLPSNLLKFYLHFSASMREGEAEKHIALLDENKDTLKDIFLHLKPELWNDSGNTLTIWLDPGRIKRDLIPNRQLGNPLKEGKKFTLVISEVWRDVTERPLKKTYHKTFSVTGRDSISPDVDSWLLSIPEVNTRQALKIDCKEALDYFLLKETIYVIDENKKPISGEIKIASGENMLFFTPESNWFPGEYQLIVSSYLEDLAGNNFLRPFDRDMQSKRKKPVMQRKFRLSSESLPARKIK